MTDAHTDAAVRHLRGLLDACRSGAPTATQRRHALGLFVALARVADAVGAEEEDEGCRNAE